jgi:hypothetical protein
MQKLSLKVTFSNNIILIEVKDNFDFFKLNCTLTNKIVIDTYKNVNVYFKQFLIV